MLKAAVETRKSFPRRWQIFQPCGKTMAAGDAMAESQQAAVHELATMPLSSDASVSNHGFGTCVQVIRVRGLGVERVSTMI